MRLLLLGGTGQVGREFRRHLPTGIDCIAPSRAELDLNDPGSITRIFAAEPWSAVVNAAGYTDVDGAESESTIGVRSQCCLHHRDLPSRPGAAGFP